MSLFLHFTAFNIFHSGLSIDSRLWSMCPDHVLRQNCTTRTELRQGLCETKYIVWKATVQTGCSSVRFRCKASIFIRKTLRVRPRNRVGGLSPTQVHRVGPAFFDEDDVCAGFWTCVTACPNCCRSFISPPAPNSPRAAAAQRCGPQYEDVNFSVWQKVRSILPDYRPQGMSAWPAAHVPCRI